METRKKRSANIIFSGGTVITMEDPIEAQHMDLALADGRILAIGDWGKLSDLEGPETRIIDVKNKTLMPGLIDSHNHMIRFGENLLAVEVSPSKVSSLEEILSKLKDRAAETPPGKWVKAWGYDDTRLKDKRHPTNKDLDRACPNHPVSVMRTCMHAMAVNSMALKIAGITSDTPDPEGGEIGRNEKGDSNGLLFELEAMNLVNRLIPHPSPADCAHSLKVASEFYVVEGLTMVCEAGAGWSGNPNEAAGFQIAWQAGDLIPRVSMGLMEQTYKIFSEQGGSGLFTGFGDDSLWIGPTKFVADGGIGARTAALSHPYEDSDYCGVMCEKPESLTKRMEQAHKAGFQISVHAIGDRALDMVLTAYESILKSHPRPHRHRIEHAAVSRPDLIKRIARLELCVVVQPAFLYFLGESFIRNLGPRRMKNTLALRSMFDKGIKVVGSSDRPVTEGNPWTAIWSAVKRTTISGQEISPDEALTTSEALKLYTRNGAFANFAEDRLGTLSPGKYADIIVLDKNPLGIDPDGLRDIQVLRTFIGGKEVYRSK
ncbi:MAG: amidohydrolase [Desulfobacteraceae bacterium]|nr:amidohydrolase [Desulfobacteraceae bacterium]